MTTNAQFDSRGERGYTLLGLLALATIIMIFATAAAPSLKQQAQREREEEAIFRGEQVAEAIRNYYSLQPPTARTFPPNMEELKKGANVGKPRRVQVLRPSAARDPLSSSGEWLLINMNNRRMFDFATRVAAYNNGIMSQTNDPNFKQFDQQFQMGIRVSGNDDEKAPGDEDQSPDDVGTNIAVVSRSRRQSIINYYGVSRHDHWVFTPMFR